MAKAASLAVWISQIMEKSPVSFAAICSSNRAEYVVVDLACAFAGVTSVALHKSWTVDDHTTVLNDVRASVLFCDAETLPLFISLDVPPLRHIVCFDSNFEKAKPQCCCTLSTYDEVVISMQTNLFPNEHINAETTFSMLRTKLQPCSDDSLFAVVYSSGTSGGLKGVPVTRKKWFCDSDAGAEALFPVCEADRAVMSYAPLAHGMDRGCVWGALFACGRIGFARKESSDNFDAFIADAHDICPALLTAMPHIWNHLFRRYNKRISEECLKVVKCVAKDNADTEIVNMLAECLKHAAVNMCGDDKRKGLVFARSIEANVLKECREMLGGKVCVVGTGGAATDASVIDFLGRCFAGGQIVDAYGSTEVPGISSNGVISPNIELHIDTSVAHNLCRDDDDAQCGEIVVRAPNVACAYFGTTEAAINATKKAYDSQGWYHTGDLGELDKKTGKLRILGRVRGEVGELYLQGQSVWVSLPPIEAVFSAECPNIKHICLHADRTDSVLLALVDPVVDGKGKHVSEFHVLCEIREAAKKHNMTAIQIPASVVFSKNPWSDKSGELTETQKVRRPRVISENSDVLAAEYVRLAEAAQRRSEISRRNSGDFLADFTFVCDHLEDEEDMVQLLEQVREAALLLRQEVPRASAESKTEEKRLRDSLRLYYDSAMSNCDAVNVFESDSLLQMLRAVKQELKCRQAEIRRAETRSDPVVDALRSRYNESVSALSQRANQCGMKVPFQITAGLVTIPPASARERGGNCLAEGLGLDCWRVICSVCGNEIECGQTGAGTERFICVDCNSSVVFCQRCHALMDRVKQAGKPLNTHFWNDYSCTNEHTIVREYMHPVWMRDAIIEGSHEGKLTLFTFVQRIFREQYSQRPCVLTSQKTFSYGCIWNLSQALAAFLLARDSLSDLCVSTDDESMFGLVVSELAAIRLGVNIRLVSSPGAPLLSVGGRTIFKTEFDLLSVFEDHTSDADVCFPPESKTTEIMFDPDSVICERDFISDAQKNVYFDVNPFVVFIDFPKSRTSHSTLWSSLLCGMKIVQKIL